MQKMLRTAALLTSALVLGGIATGPATLGSAGTATTTATTLATTLTADADTDACTPDNPRYMPEVPAALDTLQSTLVAPLATGVNSETGESILVAVVDSGIDPTNKHLAGKVVPGIDLVLVDGARPDGLTDLSSHGTAVAGIIVSQPVDGSGLVGLAPGATVMPVRVFGSNEDTAKRDGSGPDAQRMAAGIVWAADHGATIINVSMSDSAQTSELIDAVDHAEAMGSLVVASAGNRSTATNDDPDAPRYPAGLPNVLGVTALDENNLVNDDSYHGPQVDVSAPGKNIISAYYGGGDCQWATDSASSSYATAYASAAAALVAGKYPNESPAQWRYRLMATASRNQPDARDNINGWGIIQPYDALTFIPDNTARGPENPWGATQIEPQPTARAIDLTQHVSPLIATRELAMGAGVIGVTGLIATLLLVYRPGVQERREARLARKEARRSGG